MTCPDLRKQNKPHDHRLQPPSSNSVAQPVASCEGTSQPEVPDNHLNPPSGRHSAVRPSQPGPTFPKQAAETCRRLGNRRQVPRLRRQCGHAKTTNGRLFSLLMQPAVRQESGDRLPVNLKQGTHVASHHSSPKLLTSHCTSVETHMRAHPHPAGLPMTDDLPRTSPPLPVPSPLLWPASGSSASPSAEFPINLARCTTERCSAEHRQMQQLGFNGTGRAGCFFQLRLGTSHSSLTSTTISIRP